MDEVVSCYILYFDWQYRGIEDIRICGQGMDEVVLCYRQILIVYYIYNT